MRYSLLVAEDDQDMANLLAELAGECGFATHVVHQGSGALAALAEGEIDAMLTDLCLPAPDGLALLRHARSTRPDMPVAMITGFATVHTAIDAFRAGVFDIVTKPFQTDDARAVLRRMHDLLNQRDRLDRLAARLAQVEAAVEAPVAKGRAMRGVMTLLHQVGDTDIPVLLTGETGTGKTQFARVLHQLGPRREGPFFALNCGGIAPSLAESELFGFEKGAFTGAAGRKKGLLELADGGTLLLDEINSAPPEIQARLLQFLQDRTLMRVGGQRAIEVDVRLVFASNEPLERLVDEGRFRADLYYRLKVFPIGLPPLRERQDDLLDLTEQLLSRVSRALGKSTSGITPEALECLRRYAWPGNVRELENVLQRAVILAGGGPIAPAHLPDELRGVAAPAPAGALSALRPGASLAEVEHFWIRHMLASCDGNKQEAARRLGIDPSTLYRKLKG